MVKVGIYLCTWGRWVIRDGKGNVSKEIGLTANDWTAKDGTVIVVRGRVWWVIDHWIMMMTA